MNNSNVLNNLASQLGLQSEYQQNKPMVDQAAGAIEQNTIENRDNQWQSAMGPDNMGKVRVQMNQNVLQQIKNSGR